jgi:Contractile injection system tube protein
MTVELWFDATGRAAPEVDDVRQVTDLIAYFMRPVERRDGGLAPPPVRFQWGTFSFDGVMETMEETLELFAADGRPLRARVSISIAARPIVEKKDPRRDRGPGTRPRAPIRQNESLQQAMGRTGSPEGWQEEAERNGIENPRRPPVGSSVGLSDQGRS